MKKILAISGNIRALSLHLAILKRIESWLPDEIEFEIFSGLSEIPHFNQDLDNDNPPEKVSEFRAKLKTADAVIICTPEYAFGIPGTLKNALDWTVSSGEFVEKPVALITASSVGEKGHAALINTLTAIAALLSEEYLLLIPFIRSKMDGSGKFSDQKTEESIRSLAINFANSIP